MIIKALIFIQIHHPGENAEEKYIWKNYNIYVFLLRLYGKSLYSFNVFI